jgi:hypothetical protein
LGVSGRKSRKINYTDIRSTPYITGNQYLLAGGAEAAANLGSNRDRGGTKPKIKREENIVIKVTLTLGRSCCHCCRRIGLCTYTLYAERRKTVVRVTEKGVVVGGVHQHEKSAHLLVAKQIDTENKTDTRFVRKCWSQERGG